MLRKTCFLTSLILLPAIALTGCLGTGKQEPDLTDLGPPPNLPSITVEFWPESGKPEQTKLPVSGVVFLSDVLKQVDVESRFRRYYVVVERKKPNGRMVKMPVEKGARGEIGAAYDYAIHAGDRVVVRPSTPSSRCSRRLRRGADPLLRHAHGEATPRGREDAPRLAGRGTGRADQPGRGRARPQARHASSWVG